MGVPHDHVARTPELLLRAAIARMAAERLINTLAAAIEQSRQVQAESRGLLSDCGPVRPDPEEASIR